MNRIVYLLGNLVALTAAFGLLARYVPPQAFWPPAVVALLLPGLLLLTLLYLVFALWRRRRWLTAILPAAVILFSVPILSQLFAWPAIPAKTDSTAPHVVFLTGNQRLFRTADGEGADAHAVTKAFHEYDAEVIMLQEIRPPSDRINYISSILANPTVTNRHQKRGTLIATYADTLRPVTSAFTEPNEYNGYIVTDVETELGTIRVINAHLESNQISRMAEGIRPGRSYTDRLETFIRMLAGYGRATRLRASQAEAIRKLVEDSPHPVVLGGDFNDVPSSYTYNRIHSPRLRDAWVVRGSGLGPTFTGPLPGLRIDYFLVDTSLQVNSIKRMPNLWSDHRPLRMEISKRHGNQ